MVALTMTILLIDDSATVGLNVVMGPGPSPFFSEQQEWKLVDHLSKLASY